MTRIFLSYARGDDVQPYDPATSWVQRLAHDLTAAKFDVWFDRVSLPSRGLTFHQEIRDAVAACDRLLLVVGPKAASSEYVQQEWQFALFEAEKVITPILRAGDYPLAIPELALLHAEDFRDEAEKGGGGGFKSMSPDPVPPLTLFRLQGAAQWLAWTLFCQRFTHPLARVGA